MRDRDFKCIYCGKYVPFDKRVTIFKSMFYWNGFYEDVEESTEIYHKKCKPKTKSKFKK